MDFENEYYILALFYGTWIMRVSIGILERARFFGVLGLGIIIGEGRDKA